jgi:hypothetical protein
VHAVLLRLHVFSSSLSCCYSFQSHPPHSRGLQRIIQNDSWI